MELARSKEEFTARGINVAALSYDSAEALRHFAERQNIDYPLLSDPDSEVIRAFGILNESVKPDSPAYGMPHPGSYLVDANGVVEAKFFEENYRERVTAASVLTTQMDWDDVRKATVENPRLKLTWWASNRTVRLGQRVSLVLEVELKPKMHVYAPGVEGYIPIEWTLEESENYRALGPTYPESKMLHLDAIDETVPVYEGAFRVERDIIINAKEGAITASGAFRYQACDDRMCYRPDSIPLDWIFDVQPHDRERVPESMRRR